MSTDESTDQLPGYGLKLTSLTRGGGCACKLSPSDLERVLAMVGGLGAVDDPRLLVGLGGSDDAAVYQINDEQAIVLTTDFFTPIVDDAYDFGRIAATNALSDVYAMGGTPILALNLVAFPRESIPLEVLSRILDGGLRAAREAGCLVAGGHSIDDPEPKYGMAVVGLVHPDRLMTNAGGRPGDVLVLTKPLGIGAITTALKRELASATEVAAAVELMTISNRGAALAVSELGVGTHGSVHAGTDITGFGLLGHLFELTRASGLSAEIDASAVPALVGARELLQRGVVAGGTQRNHAWISPRMDWNHLAIHDQYLLADAQTSGGLLLSCHPDSVEALIEGLGRQHTPSAAVVGRLVEGTPGACRIV